MVPMDYTVGFVSRLKSAVSDTKTPLTSLGAVGGKENPRNTKNLLELIDNQ